MVQNSQKMMSRNFKINNLLLKWNLMRSYYYSSNGFSRMSKGLTADNLKILSLRKLSLMRQTNLKSVKSLEKGFKVLQKNKRVFKPELGIKFFYSLIAAKEILYSWIKLEQFFFNLKSKTIWVKDELKLPKKKHILRYLKSIYSFLYLATYYKVEAPYLIFTNRGEFKKNLLKLKFLLKYLKDLKIFATSSVDLKLMLKVNQELLEGRTFLLKKKNHLLFLNQKVCGNSGWLIF